MPVSRLESLAARLGAISAAAACLALAGLILLVTVQVIGRAVTGVPMAFTDEIGGFLMVAITCLGLAESMRQGTHIRVEVVVARLAAPALRRLAVVSCAIAVVLAAVLVYRTTVLVVESVGLGSFSPDAQLPLAPVQAVMTIGFLLLCLQLVVQLVNAARARS